MSIRTTLIVFAVVFALGVLAVVILPFVLGARPPASGPRPIRGSPDEVDRGVFRSDDGGRTWASKSFTEGGSGSIAALRVNRLIPDPVDPATFYLLTDGGGLWVSRSRGDEWTPVTDGAGALDPGANVLAIAVNPDDRREWYVAAFQQNRGRVLMSADGGGTFREIYFTPEERFGVFDLHFDRARRSVIIATGQGGLLETTDRGRTWRVRRWFADGLIRLLADPSNASVWYAATSRGHLFRTLDRGGTWSDASEGFDRFGGASRDQRWVIDRAGALYLGSRHGLLRSRDSAATFEAPPLIIPPDALPIAALAVDPLNARRILAAASGQLYGSEDDGASWLILASPSPRRIMDLVVDALRPGVIYAVVQP